MQNSDQPIRPTDKNKGDQSAVEQQQKEQKGKKPSPEADQQVTGKEQHITNNDGAPVNASRDTQDPQNMWGPERQGQQEQGKQDMSKKGSSQQNDQWSKKDNADDQDQQNKGNKGSGQGQNKNQGK